MVTMWLNPDADTLPPRPDGAEAGPQGGLSELVANPEPARRPDGGVWVRALMTSRSSG